MSTKIYSIHELAELFEYEVHKGIICVRSLLNQVESRTGIQEIYDVSDELRLCIERTGDNFQVTKYVTEAARAAYGQ